MSARSERFMAAARVSNTKRKLRQAEFKAKHLADTLARTQSSLLTANRRVADAMAEGATRVLQTQYLPDFLRDMAHALAHEYGEKAQEHLDKLKRSDRFSKPISLAADFPVHEKHTLRITGTIPELRYGLDVRD